MTDVRIEIPVDRKPVQDPERFAEERRRRVATKAAEVSETTDVGDPVVRRAGWRQRLVDLERGFVLGLRVDGALFVLLFGVATTVAGGLVVGLSLLHWVPVVLALTIVLVAGMFNQVLKTVWTNLGHHFEETALAGLRIGIAAVYVAAVGGGVVVALVFADHFTKLFHS